MATDSAIISFILSHSSGCVPSNIIEDYYLRDAEAARTDKVHVIRTAEENE